MATKPPPSSRARILSPSNRRASGSMTMGVMAMMAVTMPVGVVSSAHCMQLTPTVWPARLLASTHGQSFNFSRAENDSAHWCVVSASAGVPPFHNQKNQAERDGAANDALVAGGAGIGMFAGRVGDGVGFAAQDRAQRAANRGDGAGQKPGPQPARRNFQMVARGHRDGHAGEDDRDAKDFRQIQSGAEPEPFDQRGARGGEALREQDCPAAAKPRQGLKIRRVAQADAGEAAQNENGKCNAGRARAEKVRPDGQEEKRAADAPEIGLDTPQPRGGAMPANGGHGKQQRGQERGKHDGYGRKRFDAAISTPPRPNRDE